MKYRISRASQSYNEEIPPCAGCERENHEWMIEIESLTDWIKCIAEAVIISPPTAFREYFEITIYDSCVE